MVWLQVASYLLGLVIWFVYLVWVDYCGCVGGLLGLDYFVCCLLC